MGGPRKRFYRRVLSQQDHSERNITPRAHLAVANELFERGKYLQAARLYEQLGLEVVVGGLVERSPFLYLQASRAYFLARHADAGNRLLRYGIKQLAEAGRWSAAGRIGRVCASQVRHLGYTRTADDLLAWLDKLLAGHTSWSGSSPVEGAQFVGMEEYPAVYSLEICPHCGAGFAPTSDGAPLECQAVCPYCGSTIAG